MCRLSRIEQSTALFTSCLVAVVSSPLFKQTCVNELCCLYSSSVCRHTLIFQVNSIIITRKSVLIVCLNYYVKNSKYTVSVTERKKEEKNFLLSIERRYEESERGELSEWTLNKQSANKPSTLRVIQTIDFIVSFFSRVVSHSSSWSLHCSHSFASVFCFNCTFALLRCCYFLYGVV